MINKRFLNFKTYNGFLAKKDQIPEDSIVFIQDKPCIWARGKEYICDGPSIASVERDTLTFKNGNDKTIFTLQQNGGILTIKDSNGNEISATYALKSQLSDVAFSGSYNDLINTPDPIVVDRFLESGSENPIENNAVYTALQNKADKASLDGYVQTSVYNAGMKSKQDKLVAGPGISIYKDSITKENVIKTTLDTNVYEFVTEIPDVSTADPNKIYILEINNGDGTYRYEQFRLRDGQFVSFDVVMPEIRLDEYLKQEDADSLYQPKANNYVTSGDLAPYAKIQEDINPILSALNDYALKGYVDNTVSSIRNEYATKNWVIANFVQQLQVYFSEQREDEILEQDEEEPSSHVIQPSTGTSQIIVDINLDPTSINPVQNSAVALAIKKLQDDKANKTQLLNYYTKTEIDSKLGDINLTPVVDYIPSETIVELISGKQDRLTAGNGISIINNEISTTLDTEAFVIVSGSLPTPPNVSPNKIYILETIDGNDRIYTQWRWDQTLRDWVMLGSVSPEVNLEGYLKISDANATYAPKGNYATQMQLTALRANVYNDLQRKGNYATVDYLENILSNSDYLTSADLTPYALSQDLNNLADSIIQNYALKQDVEDLRTFVNSTYVKLIQLYTEDEGAQGTEEESQSTTPSGNNNQSGSTDSTTIVYNYNMEVDQAFDATSSHAIANWLVKRALDKKLEASDLTSYAKLLDLNSKADISFVTDNFVDVGTFQTELNNKQDTLVIGDGLSFDDEGVLSVDLNVDTDLFVIVEGDLPTTNINENKIYLQEVEVDGETRYKEWRRKNDVWVEIGTRELSVDLSGYITEQEADAKYLISEGTYLTQEQGDLRYDQKYQQKPETSRFILASEVEGIYQEAGDYVTMTDFSAMRNNIENTFQKKGDYALASDVNAALTTLQTVIDSKYVLKKDVYNPNDNSWSSSEVSPISVTPGSGNGSAGYTGSNMITLTAEEYESLVRTNMVDPNTYYFTYEGEAPSTDWHFGDSFPITFTENWAFGGTFPIILR